jgi:hypothetical protein
MMKRVQFEQALRSRLDRQPFQPFLIEFEDGSRREIRQKQDLSYWKGNDALYVHPDGSWEFVDRDDVAQILDLTPVSPA